MVGAVVGEAAGTEVGVKVGLTVGEVVYLSKPMSQRRRLKAKAKATIDDLTEKFVTAHRLERDGQFESDINAEAAKLRATHNFDSQNVENWLAKRDSEVEEEKRKFLDNICHRRRPWITSSNSEKLSRRRDKFTTNSWQNMTTFWPFLPNSRI